MTKKEKAYHATLEKWDKYLLDQYRKGNVDFYLKSVDEIIQRGVFQRFHIKVEDRNNVSEEFCHFVFDMCGGINGYFDGDKFVADIPFYYLSKASSDMREWAK